MKPTKEQIISAWRHATGGRCYGLGSARAMLGDDELAAFANRIADITIKKYLRKQRKVGAGDTEHNVKVTGAPPTGASKGDAA